MSSDISHFVRSAGVDPVAAFAAFFSPIDKVLVNELATSRKEAYRHRFSSTVDLYNKMFDQFYRPDLTDLRNLYNHYGVQIAGLRGKSPMRLREIFRNISSWQHYYGCVAQLLILHNPTEQILALKGVVMEEDETIEEPRAAPARKHNQKKWTRMLLVEERAKMRKIAQPFSFIYKGALLKVTTRHFQMPLKDAAAEIGTTSNKLSIAWSVYCEEKFNRKYRWPGTFLDYDRETTQDDETEDLTAY